MCRALSAVVPLWAALGARIDATTALEKVRCFRYSCRGRISLVGVWLAFRADWLGFDSVVGGQKVACRHGSMLITTFLVIPYLTQNGNLLKSK